MKIKKQIITAAPAILISVFLVCGVVFAVTTIGTNITTEGNTTLGDAAADTVHFNANAITFEGATADAFETTFAITDPTADRTVTFQDVTGTVYVTGGTDVADADVVDALTITGGTVNNSVIGGVTPVAGTFTTLTANTSLTINAGAAITKVISELTAAIDLANALQDTCVTGTDAVAGAALGDTVTVNPSADDAAWDGGNLTAFVESAGTVKIVYCNNTAGALDPASMTYRLTVIQF